jgi:hypothetical protein
MAIQLSERDNLIFQYINEHHVLLEKHIAWFISCDEKPVLIRDRLRKLFYLDYLLCERHGGKLPWWTTPTKPLVYMLSPMSKQLMKAKDSEVDLNSAEIQRHLLEVANLRMLFLVDQKEGHIADMQWTTLVKPQAAHDGIDAVVSMKHNGKAMLIGLVNHPVKSGADLQAMMQKGISEHNLDTVWIVCRDEAHRAMLQKDLVNSSFAGMLNFTTHQEVYRSGMARANWQSVHAMPSAAGCGMVA